MKEAKEERSASLMLSVEEIDMPTTTEGILTTLRRILSKPYVQAITLRTGRPIEISWYKAIADSLRIGEPEDTPDVVLGRVDLEEFSTTKSPKETLVEALLFLSQKQLYASHLFVGSVGFFRDWIGIPSVVPLQTLESVNGKEYYNFIGLNLLEVDSLEEDVVVLLGSDSKGATTTEISFGLKIVT
jgi:hypothetical protein